MTLDELWDGERSHIVSSGQLAAILNVDVRTVSRWARSGTIPSFRTLGKTRGDYRFDLRQIAGSFDGEEPGVDYARAREVVERARSAVESIRAARQQDGGMDAGLGRSDPE